MSNFTPTKKRGVKVDLVDFYNFSLFSQASRYDMSAKADRLRSVKDLERLFFRIVGEIKPELFIEAGAKDATTSSRARRHLPDARIVAFEANPFTYQRFNDPRRFTTEKIEYTHLALSENIGSVTFNVRKIDGVASADGSGSILESSDETETGIPVTVDSSRLDAFFRNSDANTAAVWMDVEGANKPVLTGATHILSRVQTLFIEVQDRPLWKGQWLTEDVSKFLMAEGFIPIGRDFQSRYLYNMIFVHRNLLWVPRVRHFLTEHLSGPASVT